MVKICDYFTFGRHKKMHCIYLSQSYFQTPILIRKNCSHFCLYNIPGRRELRTILIDHGELTEEDYKKNTSNYDFVMINKITKTVKKNFDVEI